MAALRPPARPNGCLRSIFRQRRPFHAGPRLLAFPMPAPLSFDVEPLPPPKPKHALKRIKIYPPPPSTRKSCPEPIKAFTLSQLSLLDPTGARTQLFAKDNPEAVKVGDILLVRLKSGEPFAGVCLNIRRRGVETGILLRNTVTRVGVEMWFKIYSPNVQGIEVVQRREKRARRARLYYLRQPRHDIGSVENIVRQYLRQRAMLRSGDGKGRGRDSKKRTNRRGRN